jgi:hypothetical protein
MKKTSTLFVVCGFVITAFGTQAIGAGNFANLVVGNNFGNGESFGASE